MNSYEIMLSESQERMLVIVQKGREREIEEIFEKWDLHAAHVGFVTDTERMVVKQHGVTVADIPASSLTDAAPVYKRESKVPTYLATTSAWTIKGSGLPDADAAGVKSALEKLLSHPTIASKRWVYRQYDHMVRHGTVVIPGSDAGVVRLRLGDKEKFIAISNDCNGRYCYLNPYRGALIAMVECMRNLVCAGATPLAMTDNLNFGNPYKPENFFQLKECVRGLADACNFFDVPVVGGNVSLYNESPEGAIDPTPTVSVVGFIEEEKHITKQFARAAGEKLVLLGEPPNELGGSQYLGVIHGLKTGDAPEVDLAGERKLQNTLLTLIKAGAISAAHDLSEGGLLVAAAEMLFGPDRTFGAKLDLQAFGATRFDALLFGESQGRIIVAVKPEKIGTVLSEAHTSGLSATLIGEVTESPELTLLTKSFSTKWPIASLREGWETTIERAMARPGLAS